MDFSQKFELLKESIYTDAYKLSAYEVSQNELDMFVNEIVAYLLVLSYSKHRTTNINKYDIEYSLHIETDPFFSNEESINSLDDSGLQDRMRKAEKFLREGQEKNYKMLDGQGVYMPPPQEIKYINQGRFYDKANLLMIDHVFLHPIYRSLSELEGVEKTTRKQSYSLYELFMHKDITNSKKVSTQQIINAYNDYELLYDKAKTITDYKTYLDYWVLLYRTEIRMHFTLINQIADYMLKHNVDDVPNQPEIADLLWNVIPYRGVRMESYSVLRYNEYIPYLFDSSRYNNVKVYSRHTRYFKHYVLCKYLNVEKKVFREIFKSDNTISNQHWERLFHFCRNEYPIIHSHAPININDPQLQSVRHKKIKLIRKIVPIVLPIEEYQNIYQGK